MKKSMNKKYLRFYVKALNGRSEITNMTGDYAKALEDALHALELTEQYDKENYNSIGFTYELLCSIYSKTGDYDKLKLFADKAYSIYSKIADKSGQSAALGYISDYYLYQGDADKALEIAEKSRKISEQTTDLKSIAESITNIGFIYSDFYSDFKKALGYHKRTLKIAQKTDDKQMEGASMNNIANVYQMTGELDKAFEYYTKSISIIEPIGEKEGIASIYNNIGAINFFTGNPDEAAGCFKKSLEIRKQTGNKRTVGISLHNLGFIHEELQEFEKALNYYKESLVIREGIDDKLGMSQTLNNLGKFYKREGEYQTALKYFRESESIKEQIGDRSQLFKVKMSIGLVYKEMNRIKKSNKVLENLINQQELPADIYYEAIRELYDNLAEEHIDQAERLRLKAENRLMELGEDELAEKIRELG